MSYKTKDKTNQSGTKSYLS